MGEDTTRNMYSTFSEINKLCDVASRLEIYQNGHEHNIQSNTTILFSIQLSTGFGAQAPFRCDVL